MAAKKKRKSSKRKSKVGLTSAGKLKKGYKFKRGGGVVKVGKK